jgi:hypothetical protein
VGWKGRNFSPSKFDLSGVTEKLLTARNPTMTISGMQLIVETLKAR